MPKPSPKTGDGSSVGLFISLPDEIAFQFPDKSDGGGYHPHVTFLVVGEVPKERREELLGIFNECFASFYGPVKASLGDVDYFYNTRDDVRVKHVTVRFSKGLSELRQRVVSKLEDAGFEVSDFNPNLWFPHTTLEYLDDTGSRDFGSSFVPGGSWVFNQIEVWGLPKLHTVDFNLGRVAKYKEKKQKSDSEKPIYVYSERQIALRHKNKSEKIQKLSKSLSDLRAQVKRDLQSKDEKKRNTALAVALIDSTYERVGNKGSAEKGHFGVTQWLRKHVKFDGGKATIKYIGKSGVSQKKEIDDKVVVKALKKLCSGKEPSQSLFSSEGVTVTPQAVNEYLSKFKITAKDLRGLHANREMKVRLKKALADSKIGEEEDYKDYFKKIFKSVLEETAGVVGHTPSTLKNHYLVPTLEETFLKDGTIIDKFATLSRSEKEDREVQERMVKKSPKKKPSRRDKRNRRLKEDPDLNSEDKDLSKEAGRQHFSNYSHGVVKEDKSFSLAGFKMKKKASKNAVRCIASDMDRIAGLFEHDFESLGVPGDIARDYALRTDLLSDHISKEAGISVEADQDRSVGHNDAGGFDPDVIGEHKSGPLHHQPDEPYMKGEFTQQEFRELRERAQKPEGFFSADKKASKASSAASCSEFCRVCCDLATAIKLCKARGMSILNKVRRLEGNFPKSIKDSCGDWQKFMIESLDNQISLVTAMCDAGLEVLSDPDSFYLGGVSPALMQCCKNACEAVERQMAQALPAMESLMAGTEGSLMDFLQTLSGFCKIRVSGLKEVMEMGEMVLETCLEEVKSAISSGQVKTASTSISEEDSDHGYDLFS